MAGGGAKKRVEDNARTLRSLGLFMLLAAALHAGVRLGLRRATAGPTQWLAFGGSSALQALCYVAVMAVARPTYEHGVLVDGGGDLSKGAVSFYFDVAYVNGAAQALAAFFAWGWWALALVPAYGTYALLAKLPGLWRMVTADDGSGGPVDEAELKRSQRAQQRSERRRVKRF